MKLSFFLIAAFSLLNAASAQDISGKWFGKITQQPGAYSQSYELELNINQRKKQISGETYATITDSLYIKIGLQGSINGKSVFLKENIDEIRQEILPSGWYLCVKNLDLNFFQNGKTEYMEGAWTGKGRDGKECIPGRVLLARSKEDLDKYLASSTAPETSRETSDLPPATVNFSSLFLNTEPKKVTEIEVHNADLKLQLSDYLKNDNDTVSVYLNRNAIASKIWISKRAAIINFKLDTRVDLHELLLFAENLGQIPPNTSELLLIDGDKTHRVRIESDKQKTAAVYLRYKP